MKITFIGGPLDGHVTNVNKTQPRYVFVRGHQNIYVNDNDDPRLESRQKHVYENINGQTYTYKQKAPSQTKQ